MARYFGFYFTLKYKVNTHSLISCGRRRGLELAGEGLGLAHAERPVGLGVLSYTDNEVGRCDAYSGEALAQGLVHGLFLGGGAALLRDLDNHDIIGAGVAQARIERPDEAGAVLVKNLVFIERRRGKKLDHYRLNSIGKGSDFCIGAALGDVNAN